MPIAISVLNSIMMMLMDMGKQVKIHKNEAFGLFTISCDATDRLFVVISIDYQSKPHTVSHPVSIHIESDIHGVRQFHYEFEGSKNNIEQDIKRYG